MNCRELDTRMIIPKASANGGRAAWRIAYTEARHLASNSRRAVPDQERQRNERKKKASSAQLRRKKSQTREGGKKFVGEARVIKVARGSVRNSKRSLSSRRREIKIINLSSSFK